MLENKVWHNLQSRSETSSRGGKPLEYNYLGGPKWLCRMEGVNLSFLKDNILVVLYKLYC